MTSNLPDLPESKDEYWEDAEKHTSANAPLHICPSHTKEKWMTHEGYKDNKDGTISCTYCSWGTPIPGYLRVIDGRVLDLRIPRG